MPEKTSRERHPFDGQDTIHLNAEPVPALAVFLDNIGHALGLSSRRAAASQLASVAENLREFQPIRVVQRPHPAQVLRHEWTAVHSQWDSSGPVSTRQA